MPNCIDWTLGRHCGSLPSLPAKAPLACLQQASQEDPSLCCNAQVVGGEGSSTNLALPSIMAVASHHVQINAQPLTAPRFLFSQLRKAVMDHISDSFLETNVPLLVLIEAAKSGNEKEVKEYAQVFREHANKLVEVSQAAGWGQASCLGGV
ncbi:Catenin alpha-2 [Varanus komodoensis]|nr:Catenin alpha-2 [Varanus komodoensis]